MNLFPIRPTGVDSNRNSLNGELRLLDWDTSNFNDPSGVVLNATHFNSTLQVQLDRTVACDTLRLGASYCMPLLDFYDDPVFGCDSYGIVTRIEVLTSPAHDSYLWATTGISQQNVLTAGQCMGGGIRYASIGGANARAMCNAAVVDRRGNLNSKHAGFCTANARYGLSGFGSTFNSAWSFVQQAIYMNTAIGYFANSMFIFVAFGMCRTHLTTNPTIKVKVWVNQFPVWGYNEEPHV